MLAAIILSIFDYDVMAGAQTDRNTKPGTRNRAQTRVRLEKSSLLHGVSAGNLVEFALVTTTTRNKGSGSRRCRRSARVVLPLSRTGVQVEPWRSSCYRDTRQQRSRHSKQGVMGCLIWG